MPIKGLTERRRLPRLGKIHLGIKAQTDKGVEYPKAVDYFVLPEDHPDFELLKQTYGAQPKELRILIPVEDEDKWASQYYRAYSRTRGLICKGDGETAMRMVNTKNGALADKDAKEVVMKEVTCDGRECVDYSQKCREIMNLMVMLPEIPGIGVWQIDTSSINSILNINGEAASIKAFFGRLSGIPLLLTFEAQEVAPDGKKKTVHVLHLRSRETIGALSQAALKSPTEVVGEFVALPPGDDDRPDIAPDWEPEGGPTPEMSHAEVTQAIQDFWPNPDAEKASPDAPESTEKEPNGEPDTFANPGEFLAWCRENDVDRPTTLRVLGIKGTLKEQEAQVEKLNLVEAHQAIKDHIAERKDE